MWDTETEIIRDGQRTTMINTMLGTDIQNFTYSCFFDGGGILSKEAAWPQANLFTHWLFSESDQISQSTANLLSLYNILNAHIFSFRFSIYVNYFRCPLVYPKRQVQYPVYEIHNKRLWKVNMKVKVTKVGKRSYNRKVKERAQRPSFGCFPFPLIRIW